MNHFDFFKHDLNLLVAFDALYAARSVSVAAQRVGVSQSAMSQSLKRLRAMYYDELFLRTPRGVEPTPLADALSTPLHDALLQVHGLLVNRPVFEPEKAERVFSLAMSDVQQLLILPGLLARLAAQAPGVTLRTLALDRGGVDRQLDEGVLDLAISRFEDADARHPTEVLYEERHVCLFNPKLVRLAGPMTLDDYLGHPHLLISYGGSLTGVVDEKLPKRRGPRRVVLATPYAHAVPYILSRVRAIAVVPGRLAAHCVKAATLATEAPPMKLDPYLVRMKWHARNTGDLGLRWMRGMVREALADGDQAPVARRRKQGA